MKKERSTAFNPRQYMLSRDFEIYYYSDLHFQSVGRHSHDYYEFYFFVEGAVSMELGDRCYPLLQGDVIVVPPGVQHRALLSDPTVPYRRFVFWLSRDYVDALNRQSSDYTYLTRRAEAANGRLWHFDVLTFNTLRGELFALLDELHADRFGKQTQINLNICNLLLRLNRLAHEQTHRPTKKKAYRPTRRSPPLSIRILKNRFRWIGLRRSSTSANTTLPISFSRVSGSRSTNISAKSASPPAPPRSAPAQRSPRSAAPTDSAITPASIARSEPSTACHRPTTAKSARPPKPKANSIRYFIQH